MGCFRLVVWMVGCLGVLCEVLESGKRWMVWGCVRVWGGGLLPWNQ